MSKIIGIDLGTTNSAMAVMEGGEPKIIENAEGNRTTPSVVALSKKNERLVGLLAKRQAVTNPSNTVYGMKRLIGHEFEDEAVQRDMKNVSYEMRKSEKGGVELKMGEKWYRTEEVSSMILQKLKNDAESKLKEDVNEAVITVPAYFNDDQRKATQAAGKIAGLDVKRIINEPTAAALAYGFNKKKNEKVVVYDFGGGTFDISVLEVGDEEDESTVEVKSTDGDSHMGGRDIDQKIINWIADEYKKESGMDVRNDPLALQRLDEAAEKAKHELSTTTETEVNIPFITSDSEGPKHLLVNLTRATLENLAQEYIDRSMEITERAIEASPFSKDEIDEIILVGGQTRMPKIQERVKEYFGKEANKSINPDEVVALGAAIQAGVMSGEVKDVLLLDVIPLSLGIETMGGVATKLIERNTAIPASQSQTFSTAADNQTSVEINVLQGERPMATDNKSLGRFILDGIEQAPRGIPQIEVTFDVNKDGILNVTAKDKKTGKEQSIRIEANTGLSEEEIERMRTEAEEHKKEDEKKKELVEARNTAEQMIYQAEKSLKDNEAGLPEDVKKGVQQKIDDLKQKKDGESMEDIQTATQALTEEMQKINQHAGASTSGSTQQAGDASSAESANSAQEGEGEKTDDQEVHDAEYEEKKDESEDDKENK
ncbi:MAG: molecular chaperone DnaK [Patescibacteria group bacterium]